MSSLVVSGDTSGSVTIAAPAVAGSGTLTLPVATDTLVGKATTDTLTNKSIAATQLTGSVAVANGGTGLTALGPAFSASRASGTQSINAGTYTKIVFSTEQFDTANCFDSTTNYRFTPTVAGYYQFNASINASNVNNRYTLYLYKNGTDFLAGPSGIGNGVNDQGAGLASLVYANGSDYFEIFAQGNNSTTLTGTSSLTIYFQAFLARAA